MPSWKNKPYSDKWKKRKPEYSKLELVWPNWQAEMSETEVTRMTDLQRCHVMTDDVTGHKQHNTESGSTIVTYTPGNTQSENE